MHSFQIYTNPNPFINAGGMVLCLLIPAGLSLGVGASSKLAPRIIKATCAMTNCVVVLNIILNFSCLFFIEARMNFKNDTSFMPFEHRVYIELAASNLLCSLKYLSSNVYDYSRCST